MKTEMSSVEHASNSMILVWPWVTVTLQCLKELSETRCKLVNAVASIFGVKDKPLTKRGMRDLREVFP